MVTPADSDVWQLRGDLVFRWVKDTGDSEGYWVVKDPFAREWFCLTQVEKELINLADGRRGIGELCRIAIRSLKPLETSFEAMVSFYVQARRKGLLVSVGRFGPLDRVAMEGKAADTGLRQGRWMNRLLAYRFPGINPNALFSSSASMTRLATPSILIPILSVIAVLSVAIVVAKFDVFAAELSLAFARRQPHWLALVLVTVGIAKSIHELAHVAACRLVGAECREIGVMLLFGMPCLYCDVSDLWSVPQRSKRIFVSAAGMLAELSLAGLATIVWAVTNPSTVHDLALVVMVVCSVSTVFVNANPLLRYDGYFMLADAIGVPNLSERAGQTLRQTVRRLFWGTADGPMTVSQVGRRLPTLVLLSYATMSALYRTFIVAFISLLIYHASAEIGFGWLGLSFAVAILGSMIIRSVRQVLATPTPSEPTPSEPTPSEPTPSDSEQPDAAAAVQTPTRWWRHRRAITAMLILVAMITALFAVPLPSHLVVPVLIVAADERDLHAPESGRLEQWAKSGASVRAGDLLFILGNAELEDQLRRADAEVAQAKSIVEAWQSRRGADSGNSTALALSRKRLEAAQKDRRQAAKRVQRLTIVAVGDGQLSHRPRPSTHQFDRTFRRGQLIPAGSPLGSVGDATRRSGYAIASQDQVDLIRDGQSVRIRHGSLSGGTISGVVRQVDRNAWKSVPSELLAVSDQPDATGTNYLVQMELEVSPSITLPLRTVATAEIAGDWRNMWDRLRRLFSAEFRGL